MRGFAIQQVVGSALTGHRGPSIRSATDWSVDCDNGLLLDCTERAVPMSLPEGSPSTSP